MTQIEEKAALAVPADKTYKRCLRCGRRLKTEEARMRGMGSVCWEKSKTEKKPQKLF